MKKFSTLVRRWLLILLVYQIHHSLCSVEDVSNILSHLTIGEEPNLPETGRYTNDREGWCRIVASSGDCSISYSVDGDVHIIFPVPFLEDYRISNLDTKRKLAEILAGNFDKVVDLDATLKRQLEAIIKNERFKDHVAYLEMLGDAQNESKIRATTPDDPSKIISVISDVLDEDRPNAKLSPSLVLTCITNTTFMNTFSDHQIGSLEDPLGRYFLSKSLLNGMIERENTSLSIIGARFGFDYIYNGSQSDHHNFPKFAMGIAQASNGLAKVAGPIGTLEDLSAWSFTKSIQRRQRSTSKYNRNDAVIELALDSVSTVSAKPAEEFPPATPSATDIGEVIDTQTNSVVSTCQEANEVAIANSVVPVIPQQSAALTWTLSTDWFGSSTKASVDSLLAIRSDKDVNVQHSLKFLEDNNDYLGIVFPSRTLTVTDSCKLTVQTCAVAGHLCHGNPKTLGTGCQYNQNCGGSPCITRNVKKDPNAFFHDVYICTCDIVKTFTPPAANSQVDFRNKVSLRWDYLLPADIRNGVFQCKPGRTSGFTGASENVTRSEFLCSSAVAVLQPTNRRAPGQKMIYDLKDGNDVIYADTLSTTPNVFLVGEQGTKNLYGGGGPNEFILNGDCSKTLRGKLSGSISNADALTLGNNCGRTGRMNIDLSRNILFGPGNSTLMSIENIEHVNGRLHEVETLVPSCSTRFLKLNGGKEQFYDTISIPPIACTSLNLTIYVGNYTSVFSRASRGIITTVIGESESVKSVESAYFDYDIHPESLQTHNIIYLNTPSKDIVQHIYANQTEDYVFVQLKNSRNANDLSGYHFRFYFKDVPRSSQQQTISFEEDYKTNSVLVASPTKATYFYHKLPGVEHSTPIRTGNPSLENIFEIFDSKWSTTGGSSSDEFILHTSTPTLLNGAGGDDTLRIHEDLKSGVTINLSATTPYRNIENIIGHPGNPATVTSGCTTKSIDLKGGASSAADTVNVPAAVCSNRNLQIVATGRTTVSIDSFAQQVHNDKITLIVAPSGNVAANPNQISITSFTSNPNYFVSARFTSTDWTVENLASSQDVIQMRLKSGEEYIDLHLENLSTSPSTYCQIPYIQLAQNNSNAHPGQLTVKRETTNSIVPEVLFHLNSTASGQKYSNVVQGWSRVQNLFQIIEGTWSVTGGNQDDIFQLNPSSSTVHIDGGTGENILMLEEGSSNNVFHVNLPQQQIGYADVTKGTLTQISHVFGRVKKPDVINCDCNTNTVNARGGSGPSLLDDIQISAIDCPQGNKMNINIAVPSFTNVANTANEGTFLYHVEDLTTTSLSLKSNQNNSHMLDIALNAWETVDAVVFDKTTNQLTLETASKSHSFEMSPNPNSPQFNNPVFVFHQPGSSVTSDIQVSSEGVTTSAISIQEKGDDIVKGLPVDVNRFLVNITEAGGKPGSIQGSEESIANQFWILNLQTPLELLLGGGGAIPAQNYLHISENFGNGEDVEVDLSIANGNMKISLDGTPVISKLENIHHYHGRTNLDYHDKAYVTCDTKSVTQVEHVVIRNLQDCEYNLVIGVNHKTIVDFSEFDNLNDDSNSTENQFTYKFTSSESFSINYHNSTFVTKATHTYLLAVTLDDLTSLQFDTQAQVLNYKNDEVPIRHKMIGGIPDGEQFYRNPVMLTQDGFRIQVDATGGIYLTLGAGSSFQNISIRSTVIPSLSRAARNSQTTIIIQTDEELIYIGHGEVEGDRNVLQNVGYSESHLVGGGAKDTIFDIVNLTRSVFIYPGFAHDASKQLEGDQKQTVDLTDIVVPIRQRSDGKYLPQIERQDDDLSIAMVGHEDEFPGKLIIVDGAKPENEGRLQFLLSNSLMDLVGEGDDWKLEPRPVYIPEGGCYTLAKEDFEIGQDIRVADASNFNPQAIFSTAQKFPDLLLTTLFSRDAGLKFKMTTVVILNYFTRIPGVTNVTTTLPGLGVIMDGATVQNKPNSEGAMMSVPEIPSWDSEIRKMEESLLETIGGGP